MLLKNNPHLQNPSPKPMAEACCQTRDQSAMEIQLAQASSPRRTHNQVHLPQEEIPKCIRENTLEERK